MKFKTFWEKNKTAFIILHWWGGSSESWEKIAKELSKDFFVIVPDFPCASKLEECNKIYTLDDYVDLLSNLVDKLNLNKFYLLWHSNWGAIATKFTVKYPEKIIKLFLNNSAWIRKDKKTSFKRKIFKILSTFLKPIFKITLFKKIKPLFYKAIGAHDYLNAQSNPNKKQTFLNMINEDLQNFFTQIKVPTILIWWENDTYTPLSHWKKINQLIASSKFIVIPNVRHWIHLQNPEKLLETIKENL